VVSRLPARVHLEDSEQFSLIIVDFNRLFSNRDKTYVEALKALALGHVG